MGKRRAQMELEIARLRLDVRSLMRLVDSLKKSVSRLECIVSSSISTPHENEDVTASEDSEGDAEGGGLAAGQMDSERRSDR